MLYLVYTVFNTFLIIKKEVGRLDENGVSVVLVMSAANLHTFLCNIGLTKRK